MIHTQYLYVWNMKHQLMDCCNIKTCMKIENGCFHNHKLFSSVYFCWLSWNSTLLTIATTFLVGFMKACHVLYNIQSFDKCENELKYWGWDAYHLFPGQE